MSQAQSMIRPQVSRSPYRDKEPRYWWRILDEDLTSPMPFQSLYQEWLLNAEPPPITEEPMQTARRVEMPVIREETAATELDQGDKWGDDASFVEEWFGEGDDFCEAKPMQALELEMELCEEMHREERMDRALSWVRSLAVATGLRTA